MLYFEAGKALAVVLLLLQVFNAQEQSALSALGQKHGCTLRTCTTGRSLPGACHSMLTQDEP